MRRICIALLTACVTGLTVGPAAAAAAPDPTAITLPDGSAVPAAALCKAAKPLIAASSLTPLACEQAAARNRISPEAVRQLQATVDTLTGR